MSHSHSHSQEAEGKLSPYLSKLRYKNAASFISKNDSVLDIGCGAGGLKRYLPDGAKYAGIDSEKQWNGAPDFLYIVPVGKNLPKGLKAKQFTVVTALAVIEHLKQPSLLFHDASKVLPVGGKFILTTPHPMGEKVHTIGSMAGLFSKHAHDEHEPLLGKKTLIKIAEQEGFKLSSYRRFAYRLNQVACFVKK